MRSGKFDRWHVGRNDGHTLLLIFGNIQLLEVRHVPPLGIGYQLVKRHDLK